jgi:predicted RNase H-like HicB family nuclease
MNPTDELMRTDEFETRHDMSADVAHRVMADPAPERKLPDQLIDRYISRAMLRAEIKQYPDGSWFAEIPGFPGVWANCSSQEETLRELEESLCEWIVLKVEDGDRNLPVVDFINLNVL